MLRIVSHVSEAETHERHTYGATSAHTQDDLTAMLTCKQYLFLDACSLHADVHAHHIPHLGLYFGHSPSQIYSHLPFHSLGLYVSLLLLLQHPQAPGGQQAAGLSGCRALRDGRDDNVCPFGDRPGTEGEIGKQNGGTEKKRKRQESAGSKRSYSL